MATAMKRGSSRRISSRWVSTQGIFILFYFNILYLWFSKVDYAYDNGSLPHPPTCTATTPHQQMQTWTGTGMDRDRDKEKDNWMVCIFFSSYYPKRRICRCVSVIFLLYIFLFCYRDTSMMCLGMHMFF